MSIRTSVSSSTKRIVSGGAVGGSDIARSHVEGTGTDAGYTQGKAKSSFNKNRIV